MPHNFLTYLTPKQRRSPRREQQQAVGQQQQGQQGQRPSGGQQTQGQSSQRANSAVQAASQPARAAAQQQGQPAQTTSRAATQSTQQQRQQSPRRQQRRGEQNRRTTSSPRRGEQKRRRADPNTRCFICNKPGHFAGDCHVPKERWLPRPASSCVGVCFVCHQQGHYAVDCPSRASVTKQTWHLQKPSAEIATLFPFASATAKLAVQLGGEIDSDRELLLKKRQSFEAEMKALTAAVGRKELLKASMAERAKIEAQEHAVWKQHLHKWQVEAEALFAMTSISDVVAAGRRQSEAYCGLCAFTGSRQELHHHLDAAHFRPSRVGFETAESKCRDLLERALQHHLSQIAEKMTLQKKELVRREKLVAQSLREREPALRKLMILAARDLRSIAVAEDVESEAEDESDVEEQNPASEESATATPRATPPPSAQGSPQKASPTSSRKQGPKMLSMTIDGAVARRKERRVKDRAKAREQRVVALRDASTGARLDRPVGSLFEVGRTAVEAAAWCLVGCNFYHELRRVATPEAASAFIKDNVDSQVSFTVRDCAPNLVFRALKAEHGEQVADLVGAEPTSWPSDMFMAAVSFPEVRDTKHLVSAVLFDHESRSSSAVVRAFGVTFNSGWWIVGGKQVRYSSEFPRDCHVELGVYANPASCGRGGDLNALADGDVESNPGPEDEDSLCLHQSRGRGGDANLLSDGDVEANPGPGQDEPVDGLRRSQRTAAIAGVQQLARQARDGGVVEAEAERPRPYHPSATTQNRVAVEEARLYDAEHGGDFGARIFTQHGGMAITDDEDSVHAKAIRARMRERLGIGNVLNAAEKPPSEESQSAPPHEESQSVPPPEELQPISVESAVGAEDVSQHEILQNIDPSVWIRDHPEKDDGRLCTCSRRGSNTSGRHPNSCRVMVIKRMRRGQVPASFEAMEEALGDVRGLYAADASQRVNDDPPSTSINLAINITRNHRCIRLVPRIMVHQVAACLQKLFLLASRSPSEEVWKRLLLFPKLVLATQPGAPVVHQLRERIALWEAGNFTQLESSLPPEVTDNAMTAGWHLEDDAEVLGFETDTAAEEIPDDVLRRAAALCKRGEITRAVSVLKCAKMAEDNDETRRRLIDLHPQVVPPVETPCCSTPAPQLTAKGTRKALFSMRTGTCPGASGLSADLLKQCTLAAGAPFLEALTLVVNAIAAGRCSSLECLFGARLFATEKKCGGIRPIACGEVLRRIAAKGLATLLKSRFEQVLEPLFQCGIAQKRGLESAVIAARAFMAGSGAKGCLLKIDVTNAFNSVDRSDVLRHCARLVPELLPYSIAAYASPSLLFFRGKCLPSRSGVQQGDPLGPVLFCLVFASIVAQVVDDCELPFCSGYLDDLALGGSPEQCRSALDSLSESLAAVGLTINPSKCEVVAGSACSDAFEHFADALPSTAKRSSDRWDLLGAPCGSVSSCKEFVRDAVTKLQRRAARVAAMATRVNENHAALTILKFCCGSPATTFLQRLVGPVAAESLSDLDAATRATFESVVFEVTDAEWNRLQLPCRLGGFGLRSASSTSALACVASHIEASDCFDHFVLYNDDRRLCSVFSSPLFRAALDSDTISRFQPVQDLVTAVLEKEEGASKTQRALTKTWEENLAAELVRDGAVIAPQCKLHYVWDWLAPLGFFTGGTPFPCLKWTSGAAIRAAFRIRLGRPVLEEYGQLRQCPLCLKQFTSLSKHAMACMSKGYRTRIHTALKILVRDLCNAAGFSASLEPRPFIGPHANRRPDVMAMHGQSRTDLIDVTTTVAATVRAKEAAKCSEYAAAMRSVPNSYRFIPIVLDEFGHFGEETAKWSKAVAFRIAQQTGLAGSLTQMLCKRAIANCVGAGFGEMVEAFVAHAVWGAEPPTVADVLPVSLRSPTPSDSVSLECSLGSLDLDSPSSPAAEEVRRSTPPQAADSSASKLQRSVSGDGCSHAPLSESDSETAFAPLSDG